MHFHVYLYVYAHSLVNKNTKNSNTYTHINIYVNKTFIYIHIFTSKFTFLYLGGTILGLRGGKTIDEFLFFTDSRKTSNKKAVSVGPHCASGWNWAVKNGLDSCIIP